MSKFNIPGIKIDLLKRFKNDVNLKIAVKRAKPIMNKRNKYINLQKNIMNQYIKK